MSTNTLVSAPPAAAPKSSADRIKLPAFSKSDSLVLTVVGYNYIPSYPFNRRDEKTGQDFIKECPAIELFLGAEVDGAPAILKTWPQVYSLHEKANYRKWYLAATGKEPEPGSKPDDMVGKSLLVEVKVGEKVSKKGTKYTANDTGSITKVPSILAATATPIAKLKPVLEAALAGNKDEPAGDPY